MRGAVRKYGHLFLDPRPFAAGKARWIRSGVCEGGCGLAVPNWSWVPMATAGWRDFNSAPEGLSLQRWWCKSCAPAAGFDY